MTVGYTPSLVVGAWVGNTDSSPMFRVAGSLGAGYVWREFMDTYHRGQPVERFEAPPGVVRGRVCGWNDLMVAGGPAPQCSVPAVTGLPPAPAQRGTTNQPNQGTRGNVPAPPPPPRPTPVLPPR